MKSERFNDHILVWPSVNLSELEPECYLELIRMAFYCHKRYGWIAVVHEGRTLTGHSVNSQHYKGQAIDLHFEKDNKVVPLFDQFMASARFDWNGRGLYPFWKHPGMHLDMREEGRYDEAALWWREENGAYQAIGANSVRRIFGDGS